MAQYICAFFPKKSAIAKGVKALAVTLEAKLAKHAGMKAEVLLEEIHPDTADEYFKPKIAEFTSGCEGRPALGEFSSDWLDSNVWNDETKSFDYTPAALTQEENTEELDPLLSAKVIFDLPITERITYIAMYGAHPEEIDPEQLSNAVDMYNAPDMPDDLLIMVQGMLKLPSIAAMYPASVEEIMTKIRAVMPPAETANEVAQLAGGYAKKPAERESAEQPRTYETLDLEVALHVMGIDPDDAKPSDVRNAKHLKDSRDTAWRAWATSMRVVPGILNIPRSELWLLMKEGHENLKLIGDADARREYISEKLRGHSLLPDYQKEQPSVENSGDGKFSIAGLVSSANDAPLKIGEKEEAPVNAAETQLAPKTDYIEPIHTQSEPVTQNTAPAMAEPVTSATDQFEQRADAMEKELAAKEGDAAKNLDIWKRVQRTDPARTKRKDTLDGKGNVTRTVTSIRPTYQYLRATEIFGPFGIGWGVDVIEERFDRGIPLMESVTDNAGRETGKKVMRDGDGTIMTSLNHTMKITLWYNYEGSRGEITAYGHTKAIYANKYGLTLEDEPSKKSLTDATTKALSSLGFSADVYLGMFDDAEYSQDNAFEHDLKSATEKADDSVRLRKELDDRFATNTATMRSAVTKNELTAIASSLTRTIGTHIKSAKAVGDTQHASYLESRLRRLEEIKAECLAKFEEVKA